MSTDCLDDVLRAVADPTRRALLDRLRCGEQTVGALAEPFDVTLPAISQHLKVLREAGLVGERREGRSRVYHLVPGPLREISAWVGHYEHFWNEHLDRLGRHLEENP